MAPAHAMVLFISETYSKLDNSTYDFILSVGCSTRLSVSRQPAQREHQHEHEHHDPMEASADHECITVLTWAAEHKTWRGPPDPGSQSVEDPGGMIPAYTMVFLPQKPSTENWIILPAVLFLAPEVHVAGR